MGRHLAGCDPHPRLYWLLRCPRESVGFLHPWGLKPLSWAGLWGCQWGAACWGKSPGNKGPPREDNATRLPTECTSFHWGPLIY